MVKKKEISILVIGAILLVTAYFYLDTSDSVFDVYIKQSITKQLEPINWDEIFPRNVVKNSIPIELLDTNNNSCTVTGENFEMITASPYFVRNHEVTEKLQYDTQEKTLVVPCEELQGEKSRLNVWYVVEESKQHAMKWKYFITVWDAEVP